MLIVSGDRDTFQLVSEQVTVLYPKRGVSEISRMTPEAVVERYGLSPAQYPDYAALRGDPSDNLPNIPGVGEKTAAKWVREFGSLAALVDRVDEVKGKAGDALRAALGSVLRNRRLTELVRDVELEVGARGHAPPRLGPRRGAPRCSTRSSSGCCASGCTPRSSRPSRRPRRASSSTRSGSRPASCAAWLAEHAPAGSRLGHAARPAPGAAAPAGSAASRWPPPTARRPGSTPSSWTRPTTRRSPAGWPTRAGPKAMHDAKGPLLAIAAHGWTVAGLASDTALAAYLLAPDQRSFELADLTVRHLQRDLRVDDVTGADATGQLSLDGVDEEDLATGAMIKARAVLDLADALDTKLEELGGATLLQTVELPLVEVLAVDGAHRHRGRRRLPHRARVGVRRRGRRGRRRGVRA